MATKFFCDRCNHSTINKEEIINISIPVWQHYSDMNDWPMKSVDLCGNCIKAINKFVERIPEAING